MKNNKFRLATLNAAVVFALLLVGLSPGAWADHNDGDVRLAFRGIYDYANSAGKATDESELLMWNNIRHLKKVYADNPGEVLIDVTRYFLETGDKNAWVVPSILMAELRISDANMIRAITPHLSDSDSSFVKSLYSYLDSVDDLSHPANYIRYTDNVDTEPLVQWMIKKDPSAALVELSRHQYNTRTEDGMKKYREILWAGREIDNAIWRIQHGFSVSGEVESSAIEQLDYASRHNEWWVRLYAAKQSEGHPELRTDAIIGRLTADANPRVRQVATSINTEEIR